MGVALVLLLGLLDVTASKPAPPLLDELKRVAKNASTHPSSPWVKAFLAAAQGLPSRGKRVFFHDAKKTTYYTEAEYAKLPAATQKALLKRVVDDETYYARITDPLGYLRPLEVLAKAGFDPAGAKLLDFGYGNIGQLKMLAALGADAVGIEIDPLLPKLYAGDTGSSGMGKVTILHGYFPTDPKLVASAGKGYRLIMSKNTLKRGYVHPRIATPKEQTIDLGGDEKFLTTVYGMLKPHGWLFIYNIGPAPERDGKPYVQMADIACPFDQAALEKAGFEVLAYDVDDSAEVRAVGKLLEWDQGEGAMDLKDGVFARYTLVRKR